MRSTTDVIAGRRAVGPSGGDAVASRRLRAVERQLLALALLVVIATHILLALSTAASLPTGTLAYRDRKSVV